MMIRLDITKELKQELCNQMISRYSDDRKKKDQKKEALKDIKKLIPGA